MAFINSLFPSSFPRPSSEPVVVDYVPISATDEHAKRISLLGIEESLLQPSVPSRSAKTPRSLAELPRSYKPTRFRLLDASFSKEEKPDAWFEMLFVDVYAHARRFVEAHFGFGDIPRNEDEDEDEEVDSLWLGGTGFTREFLTYASLVARQDNLLAGWEALLRSETERKAMVSGIIAKALEDGAWDKLLFGASEEQKKLLEELDSGTVQCEESEGYERTTIRAQTINSVLGRSPLPPNFWSEVDILTSRILALLLPLLDLLDVHFPSSSATNPLVSIHADLHALVAEAGFLAVSMRRSGSIFRLVWPAPGDRSDRSRHSHDAACEVVYQVSRHAAESIEKGAAHVAAEDRARERGLPTPLVKGQLAAFRKVVVVPKVKVVVWPGLERYRRVVKGGLKGVDEVVIRKALVGYYCGKASDEADVAEGRPRLGEYVKGVREARREKLFRESFVGLVTGISRGEWLAMGALLMLGLGMGYMFDLWGPSGSYAGEQLEVHSETHPETHPEAHPQQQTWDVGSFLAQLGRSARAGLFRGEV
ncbi:hypothetical protein CONLIGDRAFT_646274 [Coniochaeta ligniaria NRRL 30616]|uniref:Uncharacterized protein n=1 Tax=Coniochaeta ligniaria NRRL 30616 TaxID=1408157 RepID=A0A1J7JFQ0_9PEZI|nr:hypothetical protein CONLIGDRAFT_646274 [Coniochaeta ligniaria NRRL 30616]